MLFFQITYYREHKSHAWLFCNLSWDLIIQQKCKCYEKQLIAKFLKTFGKKFSNQVCSRRFASLQCAECNSTINIMHHWFFCCSLQNNIMRKKSMMYQLFNEAIWSCSANATILTKTEPTTDLSEKTLKIQI